MSRWTDIEKRSSGELQREEDKFEEENSWNTEWSFSESMEELKKQQIKLSKSISDLRREMNKFRWNYTKCNYKL